MTTEAIEFWRSPAASDFPDSVIVGGEQRNFFIEKNVIRGLNQWINKNKLHITPELVLDAGSGSTSQELLAGIDPRIIFAADCSPLLLAKNPLPNPQKLCLNLGEELLPKHWKNRFGLVVASRLYRYLAPSEKQHFERQAHQILNRGGRLLVVDYYGSPYGKQMGEYDIFDPKAELERMQQTYPWSSFRTEDISFPVYDYNYDIDVKVSLPGIILTK